MDTAISQLGNYGIAGVLIASIAYAATRVVPQLTAAWERQAEADRVMHRIILEQIVAELKDLRAEVRDLGAEVRTCRTGRATT